LDEFGFGSLKLTVDDFSTQGNIIQLGYEPVRIVIITSIKGRDFSGVWMSRVQGFYGKQTTNSIDRQNLIKTKKLSDRAQDKADLELLLSEEKSDHAKARVTYRIHPSSCHRIPPNQKFYQAFNMMKVQLVNNVPKMPQNAKMPKKTIRYLLILCHHIS